MCISGMPPLYRVAKGDKIVYAYDDKELSSITAKIGKGYTIQRYKGLGEMDPSQLWETTMNPEKPPADAGDAGGRGRS